MVLHQVGPMGRVLALVRCQGMDFLLPDRLVVTLGNLG